MTVVCGWPVWVLSVQNDRNRLGDGVDFDDIAGLAESGEVLPVAFEVVGCLVDGFVVVSWAHGRCRRLDSGTAPLGTVISGPTSRDETTESCSRPDYPGTSIELSVWQSYQGLVQCTT